MAVVRRNEQVTIFPRQGAQRRRIGIEQRAQHGGKGGLGGALLTGQHDHRVRPTVAQHSECPGHDQDEVVATLDIEKAPQGLDGTARNGCRQCLHTSGAAEPDRRLVDHAPAIAVDLHRPPGLVAEIEVELVPQAADADVHLPFRSVEVGLGLDDVEG